MQGRTVDVIRSTTRAPAGIWTDGPTSAMRSPRTSTIWLLSIAPLRASNSRPARIAVTGSWADGVADEASASQHAASNDSTRRPRSRRENFMADAPLRRQIMRRPAGDLQDFRENAVAGHGTSLAGRRRYNERMAGSDSMKPAHPGVKLTYDDFVLFPDDGQRHELIDGEHYVTPSPNTRHQRILRDLHGFMWSYLERN